jgi:hypothetical protein
VPLSRNLGTLTSWNPLGHLGPVTGLLYLLQIMKLVNMQFPPFLCYPPCVLGYNIFITLSFPCDRPSFLYTQEKKEAALWFGTFQALYFWRAQCGMCGANDYYDITPLQIIYYYTPSMTHRNNRMSSGSVTSGDQFGGAATTERKEKYQ